MQSIRLLGYEGSYRDQQIQNIKDRGILNVQGRAVLDKLAANVFNVLWKKVKASIDDFITKSPESVLGEDKQVFVTEFVSDRTSDWTFYRAKSATNTLLPRTANPENSATVRHLNTK